MSGLGQTFELAKRPVARRRTWQRGWLVRRALLAADILGLAVAFGIMESLYGGASHRTLFGLGGEIGLFALTLPVWIVLAKLYRLYDRDETRTDHRTSDDLVGVFHLTTVGTWLLVAGSTVTGLATPDLKRVIVFWALAVGSIVLARALARTACRRHASYVQNTLIVGTGVEGRLIARKLEQNPHYGLRVVGFVQSSPGPHSGPEVVGSFDELPRLVRAHDIGRVIVASNGHNQRLLLEQIRDLNSEAQVDILPPFHEVLGPEIDVHMTEGIPLWSLRPSYLPSSSLVLKRSLDLLVTTMTLVLTAPLFLVLAVLIKLDSRGPVFFRQVRIRNGGHPFRIWKFRTMMVDAERRKGEIAHLNVHAQPGGDGLMFKVPDDPRTTRVGKFLRRFSIDELPQLFNVLVGEMSLVGPRPLIPDEHEHVTAWRQRRLDLKPGMTGLWQVSGRSQAPFEEMVALDYRYVTTWSLWGDLRVLLRTLPIVLRGGIV